jgi:hypothetical protein
LIIVILKINLEDLAQIGQCLAGEKVKAAVEMENQVGASSREACD